MPRSRVTAIGYGVGIIILLTGLVIPFAGAASQTDTMLRIGYLGLSTDDSAMGAQLAIDQINQSGGVGTPDGTTYQLELVTLEETPLTVESLPDAIAELVQPNVIAILGPDNNELLTPENVQALVDTRLPILSGATSNTLTDTDADNFIFRTHAPERFYSMAVADYLTRELGLTQIALVQTDIESTEAVIDFQGALTTAGLDPVERLQVGGGTTLAEEAQGLIDLNPEAVVLWGGLEDAAILLGQLRENGWTGRFAYRQADEAARAGLLPDELANGVIGVNSWSYAYTDQPTRIFLRDFVTAFGVVPGPLAAAGYDVIWFLRTAIRAEGIDPAGIQTALIGGPPLTLIQGALRPADFGNGDLIHIAVVYELGPHGGPTVVARYDDGELQDLTDVGEEAPEVPTGTPGPPTTSPVPSATLEGTWATVTADVLNVRTGPGFDYAQVGQVEQGDTLQIQGTIADFSWLLVVFQGNVGWVKTEFVDVTGNIGSVPVVASPPTPTVGATLAPTVAPIPDLVIDTVVLSPAQPIPNQPFSATVSLRNAGGGAAGTFAVAATWQPGNVYTSAFVNGLAAGQTTQVQLTGTLTGTGVFQVAVIVDLNNDVVELDENNNVYNITYRVDIIAVSEQSAVQMNSFTDWDLTGGTIDFKWDGYNIDMENGASIGVLGGTTYENVHYDALSPAVVNNTVGIGTDKVNAGVVVGIYTAEGNRAVLRIDNRQGETIWVTYRVYSTT